VDKAALRFGRPALFRIRDLEQIEEAMCGILARVGIAVHDEAALRRLAAGGFRADGGRIRLERNVVRAFLSDVRDRNGRRFAPEPRPLEPDSHEILVGVSNYPLHVHDLEADRIVPYTTPRLIEATKLVDVLHERGVRCRAPGTPVDVPGPLQPVVQLWVSATHCRSGTRPTDIKALASLPYVRDMTEALGGAVDHMNVWVFSPLAVAGESLACTLSLGGSLRSVAVGSMPSMGVSASIHAGDAFALAAAEVVGSAILVREIAGLEPTWHVNLFPADMRSLMQVFGSPENLLLQWMGSEVDAFLHGTPWHPAAGNMHVMAKRPGVQAAAERASIMTVNALLGQRGFSNAGTLSLDEIFSAEQLLYDLEIRDGVERLVRGMDGACDPDRCLADVAEALEQGSFAGLATTGAAFRDVYWSPRFFERRSLGGWRAAGCPSIRHEVHAEVRRLVARHDYALEAAAQRAIDGILARARAALA